MLETLQAFVEAEMADSNRPPHIETKGDVSVRVHLCIPDDQQRYLPKRRRAPAYLPANLPLPRVGEIVYLSDNSAWGVLMVIHQWQSPLNLKIEVWLEHVLGARHQRPTGFSLTQ